MFTLNRQITIWSLCLQLLAMGASVGNAAETKSAQTSSIARAEDLEKLGKPKRSEQFFPYTKHMTQVDYYPVEGNPEQHLRVSYSGNLPASIEKEMTPLVIPKFLGEATKSLTTDEGKIRSFLAVTSEIELRKMSPRQIAEHLGGPDKTWQETTQIAGKSWHFQNYLYYLALDGHKAFVVMFDESSNSVYEYRFESLFK